MQQFGVYVAKSLQLAFIEHYMSIKQHFKATKTAIGKLYSGIDSNLKVDLTILIDLLRELFHLSVILKN